MGRTLSFPAAQPDHIMRIIINRDKPIPYLPLRDHLRDIESLLATARIPSISSWPCAHSSAREISKTMSET